MEIETGVGVVSNSLPCCEAVTVAVAVAVGLSCFSLAGSSP